MGKLVRGVLEAPFYFIHREKMKFRAETGGAKIVKEMFLV